jgi:hypothetical protein
MIETSTILGPATITQVEGPPGHVRVERPSGEAAWARLALAVPYRPVEGDEVLVISSDGEATYVIGVLVGRGVTTLSVPGDLSIESGGRLSLKGAQAVDVTAPSMAWRAGRLEIAAHRIVQRARDVLSWVSGLFQSRSRRLRLTAHETAHVKAGRACVTARGDVRIDGRQINLG